MQIDRRTFVAANTSATMTQLAAGYEVSCGLDTSGLLWCWGRNAEGELGDGTTTLKTAPEQVVTTRFRAIWINEHTCAIDTTAQSNLYCWGDNSNGALGDGTTNTTTAPSTPVMSGTQWQALAVGYSHTCGIATTGTYCWGNDYHGTLGDGGPAANYHPSPTLVADGHTFVSIVAGDYHTCAIDNAGGGFCWGLNATGQLGIGGLGDVATPQPVAGTWKAMSAGPQHTCGIHDDGSLWCWGDNDYGQLGDGTLESRDSPIAIGDAAARWATIVAAGNHTCATQTDGTLWCWGNNDNGELGDGTAWTDQLVLVP
jgi:alpha-tubulin suppressor-like RCC1 family protein